MMSNRSSADHTSSSSSSMASTSATAVAALNGPSREDSRQQNENDVLENAAAVHETSEKSKQSTSWFWTQFMTRTGLFAPLVPEDSPEAERARQREAAARVRQEKLDSVHRWRPSQDSSISPQKQRQGATGKATRPSLMKRLSSAVELGWWGGEPGKQHQQQDDQDRPDEEEDLQQQQRQGRSSTSSRREDHIDPALYGQDGDIQLR